MNKLFKNFCGSINYNTYKNIETALLSSAFSTGIINMIMNFNGIENFDLLGLISCFAYFSYIYFSNSNGKNLTKDINEVRKLYQEFIHSYNKMNKDFGFKEPISIHSMFNYLVYNGYLSKDKVFTFSDNGVKNIPIIRGADVITGKGVCRHISSMLTDILNDYGIESANIGCYVRDIDFDVNVVDSSKYSKEEIMAMIQKNITNVDLQKKLIEGINIMEANGLCIEITSKFVENPKINKMERKYGNHAITYALYDGKSYYLDPTNSRIYRLSESDDRILYDKSDDKIMIKFPAFSILNNPENKNYYKMESKIALQNPSVSLEDEKKIINSTLNICSDNMDIFENFYNENKELYNEISHKLVKVRKR